MTRSLPTFMQVSSHLQVDLADHSVRLIISQCWLLSTSIKCSKSTSVHSYWSIGVFSWEFVRKFRVLILTKATEKKIAIFDWGLAIFFPSLSSRKKSKRKKKLSALPASVSVSWTTLSRKLKQRRKFHKIKFSQRRSQRKKLSRP